MSKYHLVTGEEAELILDLGLHPVAHKFLTEENTTEDCYPIQLGIGKSSGLVGLISPPKWDVLTPVFDWVTCNEPEAHLDDLVEKLCVNLPLDASILGLSGKDSSTLSRFQQSGFINTKSFAHPLMNDYIRPGVEVVQAAFSCEDPLSDAKYDVIIGRHILEHTADTGPFLENLMSLLSEDGVAVLEVPDNEKAFRESQHTIIWEEHTLYFTQSTLIHLLEQYGLTVLHFYRYPMALEDVMVVVVNKQNSPKLPHADLIDRKLVALFSEQFSDRQVFIKEKLTEYRNISGKVALLGAGHLGAAFVNYYQLQDLVDVIIDDDLNKQGLLMPGCKLPIQGSSVLNDNHYSLCLLTCNPWNNKKVANKHKEFLESGGRFLSIFNMEDWA